VRVEFLRSNRGKSLDLDSNIDFSVSNFKNFQITASAFVSHSSMQTIWPITNIIVGNNSMNQLFNKVCLSPSFCISFYFCKWHQTSLLWPPTHLSLWLKPTSILGDVLTSNPYWNHLVFKGGTHVPGLSITSICFCRMTHFSFLQFCLLYYNRYSFHVLTQHSQSISIILLHSLYISGLKNQLPIVMRHLSFRRGANAPLWAIGSKTTSEPCG
jgi:hypothetical protein